MATPPVRGGPRRNYSNGHIGTRYHPEDIPRMKLDLELGTVLTRFYARKRPEKRSYEVEFESRQVLWRRQAGRTEGAISIKSIKEIRKGTNFKHFERWPDEVKKIDSDLAFIIFYGSEFRLKSMSVVVSKLSSLLENDSPSVQLLPHDTSDQYVQTAGTSFCDQGVQACPSYHEHNGSSRSQGTQTDHTLLYTDQEIQTESHQVPLLVGQVTQTVLVSSTPPTKCKSTVANKCNDFDQSDFSPDGIIKYEHIQLAPKERSCNDTYTVPTRNSFAALSVEPCYEDISENPLQASECLPMKRVKSTAVSDISVKPAFNPSSHSTPSTHSGTERRSPNPTSPPKTVYKVLIIGDSIPKHLNGRRMSRRLKVLNRCLPGSNLANWIKFAPVLIEEEKPSAVIIHCGTNDINKISPSHIASLMDELCMKIQFCDPSIQISISGLTPRLSSQANGEVLFINSKLAQICSKHELYYISNNNLSPTHLSRDGIHLNRRGITGLARNFIAFLRTLHSNSFLFNVPNQRRQHTVMSQHPAHFTKYQGPTQSLNRESPEWKNWIEFVKVL
ncbi:1-phosphatidylinositol 4,5-bisphosphate phosphodiesterase gamma-1 [Holothuria leucospilota]|uniref:1-phosphatidylinositol 4,5-bisphosphate phosphodiesterase gamma-1 n=1 Tax=Holothuria leucospilota TaxID=206669 RepID=A0A9Q1CCK1_HOLLE|nr:1-phosphatidylinositol 4,5-bisphosphate phosphodiesterase gamma-1 [Holothuria leucospilota]